jgi:sterol 14-demethylase
MSAIDAGAPGMARVAAGAGGSRPPRLSRRLPLLGHVLEMRRDPVGLMQRCKDECGEIGELDLAGKPVVMLYGAEAQEAFFRAADEQLDQAAAYPFMKPVFGPGVVFDATPEQRQQALRNSALRDQQMRGHAEVIAAETERMLERWGDAGEIDLLDFFAELTIYTSSACLIGKEFREELGPELVPIFQDLERGTDAFAYVNPYLPLPSFRKRDRARAKLVVILEDIFRRREASGRATSDLFFVLRRLKHPDGRPRYTTDTIAGMFISMMFAGHHTTSTTSSWALLELLRHPEWMERVAGEIDALYADGREVSYQALREIPLLECCLKETLRLHPPLILLMRKVMSDFAYKGWVVEAGKSVGVSIAVSNRMAENFPAPERFDPERYLPGREEDKQVFAWLPFGAGRHRCVGAPFAMMQLKAIFSILLRRFEFELAQPPASYRSDHSKMVVQLAQPCRVRYRRRGAAAAAGVARADVGAARASAGRLRVKVDLDLCQGHAVCVSEAPELFAIDRTTNRVRVLDPAPGEALRPRLEAAVRYCPTRALSIEEEK